jgi:hypothetical protein
MRADKVIKTFSPRLNHGLIRAKLHMRKRGRLRNSTLLKDLWQVSLVGQEQDTDNRWFQRLSEQEW